ncbi:MAG: hypothetical protein ACP5I3_09980 [Thermoproteus sp.]
MRSSLRSMQSLELQRGAHLELVPAERAVEMLRSRLLKPRPLSRVNKKMEHTLKMKSEVASATPWTAVLTERGEMILADGTKRAETLLRAAALGKADYFKGRALPLIIYEGEREMALRLARDMNALPIPTIWERAVQLDKLWRMTLIYMDWMKHPRIGMGLIYLMKAVYWNLTGKPVLGVRRAYLEIAREFEEADDARWRAALVETAKMMPDIITGRIETIVRRPK